MKLAESANFLQRFAMPPLRVTAILIGLSVPISIALDNFLLAIVLLGLIFNARPVWQIVSHNPVARSASLLFIMLSLGVLYGATPWFEAVKTLGKYIDLAFIPLFMLLLSGETARRRAQYAFLAAMAFTLLLSYLVGLELLAVQPWMKAGDADNPVIFHSHITQNNMMAFAAFLALLNLRETASLNQKLAWGLFAALAGINVLFMVQGRTGYLILLVLLGWFIWATVHRNNKAWGKFGWKQAAVIGTGFIGLIVAVYHTSQPFHDRVASAAKEVRMWQPGSSYEQTGEPKPIAITRRLDFYYNTIQIVLHHPIVGVGTGGLPSAYAKQVSGQDAPTNPHNEYLMVAVQAGLLGLASLIYLFYMQWRYALQLGSSFERDAARGLMLAYATSCLINSSLLDHSEGLLFAFMTAVLFAGLERKRGYG